MQGRSTCTCPLILYLVIRQKPSSIVGSPNPGSQSQQGKAAFPGQKATGGTGDSPGRDPAVTNWSVRILAVHVGGDGLNKPSTARAFWDLKVGGERNVNGNSLNFFFLLRFLVLISG
jgi:hypothetical protein